MPESALETIWRETISGFEWLAGGLDRDIDVGFVPNPGNIGDALINLGCYRFLKARFRSVAILRRDQAPAMSHVFIGGGGNLVEGLYSDVANYLAVLDPTRRIHVFPSTVRGYGPLFESLKGRVRVLCREKVSHASLRDRLDESEVALGHDAAFALADSLRAAFRAALSHHPRRGARFYREDIERAIDERGDGDIMAGRGGAWDDMAAAEGAVVDVARTILGYGRIQTDRLHCAILSAMLGRYVVLRPNSYYKNEAVFDHSLSRLANVRLDAETPANVR